MSARDLELFEIEFDAHGRLVDRSQLDDIVSRIRAGEASDLVLFAPGWLRGVSEARAQYRNFFAQLGHYTRARQVIGVVVLWPCKRFDRGVFSQDAPADAKEELRKIRALLDDLARVPLRLGKSIGLSSARKSRLKAAKDLIERIPRDTRAQSSFVEIALELGSPWEGKSLEFEQIRFNSPDQLLADLSYPLVYGVPRRTGPRFSYVDYGDGILSGARRLLATVAHFQLDAVAGSVASSGLVPVLEKLKRAASDVRFHLIGHSFGGQVVAQALGTFGRGDFGSLALLQPTFSSDSFASISDGPRNGPFSNILSQGIVQGPIIITHSRADDAVGIAYPPMARLSPTSTRSFGHPSDPSEGMGRIGATQLRDLVSRELQSPGETYSFDVGRVYSLNADSIITAHDDIARPEVAWAVASGISSGMRQYDASDMSTHERTMRSFDNSGGDNARPDSGSGVRPYSDDSRRPEAFETRKPMRQVRRVPHMDLDAGTHGPGSSFKVRVFADQEVAREGETSRPISVEVPADQTSIEMEVRLSGTDHFSFPEGQRKPFRIEVHNPLAVPEASFKVTVKQNADLSKPASLTAYFKFNGRPSGLVRVAVPLEVAAPSDIDGVDMPAVQASRIVVDLAAKQADLMIEVTDPQRNGTVLECSIFSPHVHRTAKPFKWNLPINSKDFVLELMSEFTRSSDSQDQVRASLEGAGIQLWQEAPRQFREIFWELLARKELQSIAIVSEEPFIPWELMIPNREGQATTHRPLGVEFSVGRWAPMDNVAPTQEIVLSKSLVIAPTYVSTPKQLTHAEQEADYVLRIIPGERLKPVTFTSVFERLEKSPTNLVHWVCHGAQPDKKAIQSIYVDGTDQAITSLQMKRLHGRWFGFEHRPVVFLNACEVGRPVAALGGLGGFAKVFMDAGASAVIAPLWSVKDKIANKVAELFYDRLKEDPTTPLAEIMRDIRACAFDGTDCEDTFASYCFYGDPLATVRR